MIKESEIKKKIREFLKLKKKDDLKDFDNTKFLEDKYFDSLTMVEFILFLENEFNIRLTEEDYNHKEFSTLGGLVKLIKKK